MKFSEVRNLTENEVRVKLREVRKNLFEARMKNSMGQLTNPLSIREMRRDVARLNTVLRQKKTVKN